MSGERVTVVGGGLAGIEAAFQLVRAGASVDLFEMRPVRGTEAHTTDRLGELVCSNSLRSEGLETAVGLLKAEMRRMGSVVLAAAERHRVPAGACLAVDRAGFAAELTRRVEDEPGIRVRREEVCDVAADGLTIVATGPLTSAAFSERLAALCGEAHLYFYDAIAPTVTTESIDMGIAYRASRWGKGGDDYLNCPLTEAEYDRFVDAVASAEKVPTRDFERCVHFEGCMPIEEMVRRGRQTLAFGPMRPVGLLDPRTGGRPHAVVQLRQDDRAGRLYNLVGFQTKMTYPEQRRVFRMIPGLAQATFVRLGSLHRNTFVNSPAILTPTLQVRRRRSVFLAGQIVGVEGYVESAATGMLAGINAARVLAGRQPAVPPATTSLGALVAYVTQPGKTGFQPMNANYGLFPALAGRRKGRARKLAMAERALADQEAWLRDLGLPPATATSAA